MRCLSPEFPAAPGPGPMQGDGSCTAAPWGLNQQTPPSPVTGPFTQQSTLGPVTGAGEIAVIKERPSCEAAYSLARPELSGRYSCSWGSTRAPPGDTPSNEAAPRPAAPGHADTTPRMGRGASRSPPRGQSRRSRTLLKIRQVRKRVFPGKNYWLFQYGWRTGPGRGPQREVRKTGRRSIMETLERHSLTRSAPISGHILSPSPALGSGAAAVSRVHGSRFPVVCGLARAGTQASKRADRSALCKAVPPQRDGGMQHALLYPRAGSPGWQRNRELKEVTKRPGGQGVHRSRRCNGYP